MFCLAWVTQIELLLKSQILASGFPWVVGGLVVSDFLNYYPFRRILSGIFNYFWILLRFGRFYIGAFILQMIDFIHVGCYIWNEEENCNYNIWVQSSCLSFLMNFHVYPESFWPWEFLATGFAIKGLFVSSLMIFELICLNKSFQTCITPIRSFSAVSP